MFIRLVPAEERLWTQTEVMNEVRQAFAGIAGARVVVLDLSTQTIETVEEVKARVQRALEHCDAERIILAPDCGMKYLPRDVSFGKLWSMCLAAKELRKDFPREHSARRNGRKG